MCFLGSNQLYFFYDAFGTPQAVVYNGTQYRYITNLQGDIVEIRDANDSTVVTYTYDAWGKLLDITGTEANTLGTHNPLRYRGYTYDTETGLYYLQSRYYNPTIGRFISADALVSTGQGHLGNNMFVYVLNNPINFVDPKGTDAIWIQEEERADGYGHSGLLVEDESGNWYYMYWGSRGVSNTLQKIFGTPYDYVFVRIDVSGYDMSTEEGVKQALLNSGNPTAKTRSQFVTDIHYFSGDYTATYEYLNQMNNQELSSSQSLKNYKLLTNNCAQVTWNALGESNSMFNSSFCPVIPNKAFDKVRRLSNAGGRIFEFFMTAFR